MDYKLFPMTRTMTAVKADANTITVTYPFDLFLAATMRQLGLTVVLSARGLQQVQGGL